MTRVSVILSASFGMQWPLKAIARYTAQHTVVIDNRPDTPFDIYLPSAPAQQIVCWVVGSRTTNK